MLKLTCSFLSPTTIELSGGGPCALVNLAERDKMGAPGYQEFKADELRMAESGGVRAIIIAGEAFGVASNVRTLTPTHFIHFIMAPESELSQPIPEGWATFVYTLKGTGHFGGARADAHHTLALSNERGENGLKVVASSQGCEFMLVSGRPIGEPIVQHGPFVMTSKRDIQQAFMDFQSGTNGFETAPMWRSHIGSRCN